MTKPNVHRIEVRFSGAAGTSALLRLLTVLHHRTDSVIELSFELNSPQGPFLQGQVTLPNNSSPEVLERQLARPVDVVKARVEKRHERGR